MNDYLLVAVPGETSRETAWRRLCERTQDKELSQNYKFEIPELKVGTMDVLVSLSDDLNKDDGFIEGIAYKLSQYVADLLQNQKDKIAEQLVVNGRTVESYVTTFRWDGAQFNANLSIKDLAREINQKVTAIEAEMKSKMQAYSKVKGNLQAIERRSHGSLLIRSVADLVKATQFVQGSEYLVTLLVVVPKFMYREWQSSYEKLSEYVVPRSSELVYEDNESGLYTVTVFRKIVDSFKAAARDKRFIVRDFEYDATHVEADEKERTELKAEIQRKFNKLIVWCSVSFGEVMIAWMHLKALRVFVESVLRYGLPVNFQSALLVVNKKNMRRLRTALAGLYSKFDLAPTASAATEEETADAADYYPYVQFPIRIGHVLGE